MVIKPVSEKNIVGTTMPTIIPVASRDETRAATIIPINAVIKTLSQSFAIAKIRAFLKIFRMERSKVTSIK